jgi:hypothetical protein
VVNIQVHTWVIYKQILAAMNNNLYFDEDDYQDYQPVCLTVSLDLLKSVDDVQNMDRLLDEYLTNRNIPEYYNIDDDSSIDSAIVDQAVLALSDIKSRQ